ncbi:hypothetical protein DL96DRAFT_1581439 [Flagelloscypha sp. PMI_526]|nr:hypothetical protein DL96DRAFT_1581439 [Flagelloscypha sp. PMI_526]
MGPPFRPIFPDDILGLFCSYLQKPALKQCCLTSRTIRYFSRPFLFEHLTIQNSTGNEPSDGDLRFWEALQVKPEIGTLVKSLKLLQADIDSTSHWFTQFEDGSKLSYIMTHLPNLTNFSITRLSAPYWGSVPSWTTSGLSAIKPVIQHILNLPTLQNFHFAEMYNFQDPRVFHQLFRLTGPSDIRSLHLFGCRLLRSYDLFPSIELAVHHAIIKNLRLYYIDERLDGGLRLITLLTSSASSFDVTNLSSLELCAVDPADDTWIPALLDAQKSDSSLEHLALLLVRGFPKNERLFQRLSRFTSIRKLSFSAYRDIMYEPRFIDGAAFGSAAAWISVLPTNIQSSVEEIIIFLDLARYPGHELGGVDELLCSRSSNMMYKVKKVTIRLEDLNGEFKVEEFFREQWRNGLENEFPDEMALKRWIAAEILPKTYLEGRVVVEY